MSAIVHPDYSGRDHARRELRARVTQRYAQRWQRAGFLERLWLRILLARDLRAELRQQFPPSANYLGASQNLDSAQGGTGILPVDGAPRCNHGRGAPVTIRGKMPVPRQTPTRSPELAIRPNDVLGRRAGIASGP